MLDFMIISTRSTKRGVIEIYPKFVIKKSKDLMIRGGDFYAIWDEERGLWSTDEQDALHMIDDELERYSEENKDKFNVSVPVVARSKAQNLLGAISGGGHLQSCRLVAACDPVVCEENLMPCASDIVNGRYELSAETLAPNGESAPTMTAAGGTNGGFALIADPRQGRDCDYIRYTIEARKEMV